MKRFSKAALHWLSEGVYPAFVFVPFPDRSRSYLEELWQRAPFKVAFTQTVLLLFISLSPPFLLGRLRVFQKLSKADQQKMLKKLLGSRVYPFRLAAIGVRGHAIICFFRDAETRRWLSPKG